MLVRPRSAPMPGAFEGTPRKPASERVMPLFDRGKSLGKLTTDIPEIASNVINGRDNPYDNSVGPVTGAHTFRRVSRTPRGAGAGWP